MTLLGLLFVICIIGISVGLVAWLGFALYDEFGDSIKDAIRQLKSANIPSCRSCSYVEDDSNNWYKSDRFYCTCPAAIEWEERKLSCAITKCKSSDVRGTKYCQYVEKILEEKTEG